ncbi:hypothetical protein F5883DRAFT_593105 [Diaporthe sp. PMI_573]|nr:hypothetical protein F5883DRAFT_593105 [Diaporthaceae sp. PMI_573]
MHTWRVQKARKLQARVHTWLAYVQEEDLHSIPKYQHSCPKMLPSTPPESHASSASRVDQVEDALDSLELGRPPSSASTPAEFEPPKKRARQDPTPPNQDQEWTPRGVQYRRPALRAVSPDPRRRSPSPIKSIADLDRLEKPVFITEAESSSTIPPDAVDLFESLQDISQFDQFIPEDIREEFTSQLDGSEKIKDRFFTKSAVIGADGSKEDLLGDLQEIRRIYFEAQESSQLCRHEAAWNSAVHHPLLTLAFNDRGGKELGQRARARVENITSATIAGDCVPRWSGSPSKRTFTLAQYTTAKYLDSTSHSKAGSKKVDFAVVLVPPPDSVLQNNIQTVLHLLDMAPLLSRSISPSTYMPLIKSPIAIAVETKTVTASRNPLVQLGLIAAAVHRRLHTLPVTKAAGASPVTKTSMLVTLPLIAVTNHRWELYFGCDRGDKIELIGPLGIGSTASLVKSYMLLACLRLLKVWVQEVFQSAFAQWICI